MSPISRREFHRVAAGLAAACIAEESVPEALARSDAQGIDDFAYLHVSDTHLDPRPKGVEFNSQGRSVQVLEWFVRQSAREIKLEAGAPTAGDDELRLPAFAIHTGDVFEYSVVDDCWDDWQRIAQALACPVYCIAGNHDNTWSSINRQLRRLYGGDSYSFDHCGCHFVCLNSAGSLDPLPCWDERTLRWLAADLERVHRDIPVLLALHHPLSGDAGYASEYDKLRFWEVIRRHRVVLFMDGHWHQVQAGTWQNIPRVNGGETFRLHSGFATVSVAGGVLTQRYHFHESAQGGARETLVLRHRIDEPRPRYSCDLTVAVVDDPVRIEVAGRVAAEGLRQAASPPRVTAWLDGRNKPARRLALTVQPASERIASAFQVNGALDVSKLAPGRHFVTVRMKSTEETVALDSEVGDALAPVANEQAAEFELSDRTGRWQAAWYRNSAGIKSPLVLATDADGGKTAAFADTAGRVASIDATTMKRRWQYDTGSEILQGLTSVGSQLAAGDSDGRLSVLESSTGRLVTTLGDFGPLYSPGLVVDETLYFGDANGWLHAVDTKGWAKRWSRKVATYAFEAAPTFDAKRNRLLLGSWDGFYYCVEPSQGEVVWKAWNAQGQESAKSRYYGPADCSPVVVGDEVWGADRGYCLGRFAAADGKYLGTIRKNVAAIAAIPEEDSAGGAIARGLDDRLIRMAADASVLWDVEVPLGRTPLAPTCVTGRAQPLASNGAGSTGGAVDQAAGGTSADFALVGATSDRGLMTLVDGATGEQRLQWSLTPGLFVLAPLAAAADGREWYVAGMDGVVARIAAAP